MSEPMTVRQAMETYALDLARRTWPDAAAAPLRAPGKADPWFIIETEPQREATSAGHLIGRRFHVYLPAVAIWSRRGRAYQWRTQPMFRGYLFLHIPLDLLAGAVNRLRDIPGVRSLVHLDAVLDGAPALAAVQPDDMARIRNTEAQSFARRRAAERKQRMPYEGPLAIGDRVRVTDGPFAFEIGPVEEILDDQRARVLLNVLGRATPVTLPAHALEAV